MLRLALLAAAVLGLLGTGCSLEQLGAGADPPEPLTLEAPALDDADFEAAADRELPRIAGASSKSHVEPRLTDAAVGLTGFAPEVRCWSRRDWKAIGWDTFLGLADPFTLRLHLAPEVCGPLADAMYRGRRDASVELAIALIVYTHETQHFTGGQPSEAAVECRAVQRAGRAAEILFGSEADGRELARLYWDEIYPFQPDEYVTDDCRDGGPLDLEPEREGWPVP